MAEVVAYTMSYDFAVFGATGLQGRIVTRYLLEKGHKVFQSDLANMDDRLLKQYRRRTAFAEADLRDAKRTLEALAQSEAPVVVNCSEGDYNLKLEQLCLETGRHYLDLGSDVPMTQEQFKLDEAYKAKDLCAITGCGSVPGVGNVMLRHAARKLDTVEYAEAGFAWDANKEVFVTPFSIESIVEEMTETPMIVEDGELKRVPALSGMKTETFRGIGEQRVFLARHAEPYTFLEYLKPKGVKDVKFYAGFPEFSYQTLLACIRTGMSSNKPLPSGAVPVKVLTEALRAKPYPDNYKEWENLWTILKGTKNGKPKTITMNCLAPTLPGWEEHGCNIDTGIPAAIIAEMVHDGTVTDRGARSPEFFVPEKPFFKRLARWGMPVYENDRRIN